MTDNKENDQEFEFEAVKYYDLEIDNRDYDNILSFKIDSKNENDQWFTYQHYLHEDNDDTSDDNDNDNDNNDKIIIQPRHLPNIKSIPNHKIVNLKKNKGVVSDIISTINVMKNIEKKISNEKDDVKNSSKKVIKIKSLMGNYKKNWKDLHLQDKNTHLEEKNPRPKEKNPHSQDKNLHLQEKNPHLMEKNPHSREKNPHFEDKNPHLEDKNPHLEDKNPLLEDKNPLLEDKNSHLDNKNSHLEDKAPHLEEQNLHLEDKAPQLMAKNPHPHDKNLHSEHENPSIPNTKASSSKEPLKNKASTTKNNLSSHAKSTNIGHIPNENRKRKEYTDFVSSTLDKTLKKPKLSREKALIEGNHQPNPQEKVLIYLEKNNPGLISTNRIFKSDPTKPEIELNFAYENLNNTISCASKAIDNEDNDHFVQNLDNNNTIHNLEHHHIVHGEIMSKRAIDKMEKFVEIKRKYGNKAFLFKKPNNPTLSERHNTHAVYNEAIEEAKHDLPLSLTIDRANNVQAQEEKEEEKKEEEEKEQEKKEEKEEEEKEKKEKKEEKKKEEKEEEKKEEKEEEEKEEKDMNRADALVDILLIVDSNNTKQEDLIHGKACQMIKTSYVQTKYSTKDINEKKWNGLTAMERIEANEQIEQMISKEK